MLRSNALRYTRFMASYARRRRAIALLVALACFFSSISVQAVTDWVGHGPTAVLAPALDFENVPSLPAEKSCFTGCHWFSHLCGITGNLTRLHIPALPNTAIFSLQDMQPRMLVFELLRPPRLTTTFFA